MSSTGSGLFSGNVMSSLLTGMLSGGFMGGTAATSFGASAASTAASMATQALLKAYANKGSSSAGTSSSGNSASSVASAGSANTAAAYGAISSSVENRNSQTYRQVLDSLDVENNPRYAVSADGSTYCNVYLMDATEAMGAAIPRYTDKTTGEPSNRNNDNAIAMNANRISDWLNKYGSQYGWYEVTAEQAQALANRGCPAVTTWRNNSGGHGHVQMVSPSKDGTYDPEKGVAIAQAGRNLRNYTYITNIYSSRMSEVQYFAHK